jgi:hypothetical protein
LSIRFSNCAVSELSFSHPAAIASSGFRSITQKKKAAAPDGDKEGGKKGD